MGRWVYIDDEDDPEDDSSEDEEDASSDGDDSEDDASDASDDEDDSGPESGEDWAEEDSDDEDPDEGNSDEEGCGEEDSDVLTDARLSRFLSDKLQSDILDGHITGRRPFSDVETLVDGLTLCAQAANARCQEAEARAEEANFAEHAMARAALSGQLTEGESRNQARKRRRLLQHGDDYDVTSYVIARLL